MSRDELIVEIVDGITAPPSELAWAVAWTIQAFTQANTNNAVTQLGTRGAILTDAVASLSRAAAAAGIDANALLPDTGWRAPEEIAR